MKQSDITIRPKEPPKTTDLSDELENINIDLGLLQSVGIDPEQKIEFPTAGVEICFDLSEMLGLNPEAVVVPAYDTQKEIIATDRIK